MRYLTLWSLRQQNPNWEIVLYSPESPCGPGIWTSGETDDLEYDGQDYTSSIEELRIIRCVWQSPREGLGSAQVSDLLEWYVLGYIGGFYSDMDILWTKPLEPLRRRNADTLLCLESGAMAIGFAASKDDGCSPFRDIYSRAMLADANDYQGMGAKLFYHTGKTALNWIKRTYPSLRYKVLPDATVYPYDWRYVDQIFEQDLPTPQSSYGLHWFGGNPTAHRWNRLLTEKNWRQYQNTYTRCLGSLLS